MRDKDINIWDIKSDTIVWPSFQWPETVLFEIRWKPCGNRNWEIFLNILENILENILKNYFKVYYTTNRSLMPCLKWCTITNSLISLIFIFYCI